MVPSAAAHAREDVCACVESWARMDSAGRSAVMATRWFPCFARPPWCFVPGASQHRGQIFFFFFLSFFFFKVFIFSRGQRAACRQIGGFSSWRAGPAHPGHRTGRFTLASGWTLRTQLLGPPCPVQGSRSTPGVAPLSQRRLTSLAPALFRLIMEEQPQRAQASPFHPGGPGFAENT